ncbi:uncharacterized protein K441DRAFT_650162 [Cenococcum geophilum 1.58]|uniref:uncharacterized protein n=1 Tax=Cenococcum geophilum 1.58 TaxID=794803 RepID=UPI00358EC230|nr:hypothetical protein K441DRAFT_650162 [Cenococcum geophilum 1.58]
MLLMLLGCGMLLTLLGCWVLGAADAAGLWDAAVTLLGSAKVAAGVLPEGCWVLGAIEKLGVLALSEEVVLGVDLRAVEYLAIF